ncbi:MAG: DUF1573 domain-containing protein [Bacteroidetes bacterium]|nr:DUF1573 domain-containing protein [Bacteroidota bacterium]
MSSLYGRKDLTGVPIMHFEKRFVDFGSMKQGEERTFVYEFVNLGDTPLILDLVSACDCTTLTYEEGGVFQPGEKGQIKAVFDSSEKEESEIIDIDIILGNVEPDTERPIIERLQYSFDIEK